MLPLEANDRTDLSLAHLPNPDSSKCLEKVFSELGIAPARHPRWSGRLAALVLDHGGKSHLDGGHRSGLWQDGPLSLKAALERLGFSPCYHKTL